MKNKTTTWVVLGALAVIVLFGVSKYNKLVNLEESVKSQWANVENQYQRRADLIPNLVSTVKGYAAHESETLENVINARSKASQIKVDPDNMTPEKLMEYQEAQGQLGSALNRLMVVVERYPDLKANENFLDLQAQLEGTENRIANERRTFNEASQGFNRTIRSFPTNIIANIFSFEQRAYFEAEQGSEKAPVVEF